MLTNLLNQIETNETPLAGFNPASYVDFIKLIVEQDCRPEQPDEDEAPQMTDALWELAERCWQKDAKARPDINVICDNISRQLLVVDTKAPRFAPPVLQTEADAEETKVDQILYPKEAPRDQVPIRKDDVDDEFLRHCIQSQNEFYIGRREGSESLMVSMACFRLMREGLKFNICDLETSCVRNCDVEGLSERIEVKIAGSLLYSCRFWASHFRDAVTNRGDQDVLMREVKELLDTRLLFWLEVMSLTNEVSAAKTALLTILPLVEVNSLLFDVGVDAKEWICSHRYLILNYRTSFGMPFDSSLLSVPQSQRVLRTSTYPRCLFHLQKA